LRLHAASLRTCCHLLFSPYLRSHLLLPLRDLLSAPPWHAINALKIAAAADVAAWRQQHGGMAAFE